MLKNLTKTQIYIISAIIIGIIVYFMFFRKKTVAPAKGESNYQQDELTGGKVNFESNYSAAMNKAGSATNFLGY